MEILLVTIGKTTIKWLAEGIEIYKKRLSHYTKFSILELKDVRSSSKINREVQKTEEGKFILNSVLPSDYIILLDERGELLSSEDFAKKIEKHELGSNKRLVFIIGGPFGFSKELYKRADHMLSLSKMTFTHEMVKLFFIEQLYRSYTIIKGENYHH